MDLIKIACIMLAVAFFLGILTSGGKDETPAISTELENETVNSNASGVAGMAQAEEKTAISEPTVSEPAISEPAVSEPAISEPAVSEPAVSVPAPDPVILEKGESQLAGERKNIESKVRATVRLIETQGEQLFPSMRKEGSPWFQDNFCIFVWTENGTQVVCPSNQSLEGKDMKGLVDADGKPIGEFFIETAKSKKGEGWIEYNWKENNSEPFRKCTFVKKASYGEKTYLVGADLYLENYIVCRNLEGCKYTEEPGKLQTSELFNPLSLNRNLDINCSIAHSIVEPGKNVAPHMVKNPEIHYILEGQGLLYIDGIPIEIHPDQLIYIPAGSVQDTYNTGNTTLRFLIIDQPAKSENDTEMLELNK